ncbi:membrane protein insertion efficiency factor YidD [Nodosilinea sp. PGN35]|uniref:membrane protein insertion efficiency factor YidD n=1 Tax=Nodosilinea sp. PGN35 TaxID=3020489 RepID=UPI0023B2214B|nr:membrane protein insertion efficiency factor YidD [Nodosilinea sp. TSF1-S3]MDF0368663.1 membrane protein insertion efficiency factor YidD [Nodosilinea sp. TSF1-S3]
MTASTFDSLATQAAIASIDVYQAHISPRKVFSCPHRLLHGGDSCSSYIKTILTEQSLSATLRRAPQRFAACKAAAQTLTLQNVQGGCLIIPCCIPI